MTADKASAPADGLVITSVRRDEVFRLTLCGSTRFRAEYELWNKRLTLAGFLVYSVSGFGHSGDTFTDEEKARLDQVHLAKIDASHGIVVINPGGYIGDSTRREIAYAKATGKLIYYTAIGEPCVYALRTGPDGPGSMRYRAFDWEPSAEAAESAHASALARVAVLEGALAGAIAADDTLSRLAVAEGHLDKLADTLSRLLDGKRLTHEQAISTAIVNLARLVDRAALRTKEQGNGDGGEVVRSAGATPSASLAFPDAREVVASPPRESVADVLRDIVPDGHRCGPIEASADDFNRLMDAIARQDAAQAARMPDDAAALAQMHDAYTRLEKLGWRPAIYCPKDRTVFEAIEAGSTGIFDCHYEGEWPTGGWWTHNAGDLWPSRPILWRPKRALDGHATTHPRDGEAPATEPKSSEPEGRE